METPNKTASDVQNAQAEATVRETALFRAFESAIVGDMANRLLALLKNESQEEP